MLKGLDLGLQIGILNGLCASTMFAHRNSYLSSNSMVVGRSRGYTCPLV